MNGKKTSERTGIRLRQANVVAGAHKLFRAFEAMTDRSVQEVLHRRKEA